MKKTVAFLTAFLVVLSVSGAFAKGKVNPGNKGTMNKHQGSSKQNGYKTGERSLDGSGKGFGDGTKPEPKDGTGFGKRGSNL